MSLDDDAVLATAWELFDERGLDGFTLRELAQRLGAPQMAIYEVYASRAEVIDLLADDLLTRIRWDEPELVADPDERILGHALRARDVLLGHPELVPVIAARPLARPTRRDDLLRLRTTFAEAGFPEERIVPSILSLVAVTIGLVLFEQQRLVVEREGPSYRSAREQLRVEMEDRPDTPPTVTDLLGQIAGDDWGTTVFEPSIRDCYRGLQRRAGLSPD